MKILQVVPFFTPARGGSVVVAYYLSEELSRRGCEVTIITTDFEFDEEYAKAIEKKGVKVITFKCVANIGLFLFSPGMKKWLKKEIKEFDIIHLHNFRSYQNVVIHRYAKEYGIPYVLQAHGSVLRIIEKQKLKKIYDIFWGYKILKDASRLIAVSNIEAEQYKQFGVGENKIEMISNGIDIDSFKNLPEPNQFKRKYHIREKHIILFLGRIHKIKGIDFLIKSFSKLTKEMDDAVLVIAGQDDGYKREAKLLAKNLGLHDKVKFTGRIDGKDKLSAYVDADVLVYPSIFEIFGLVPFEAIMCGTPVIVTEDCGCGQLIKETKAGYLVHYGDVEELKDKMLEALDYSDDCKRMVESGKKHIIKNLSWDNIAKQMTRAYSDALDAYVR